MYAWTKKTRESIIQTEYVGCIFENWVATLQSISKKKLINAKVNCKIKRKTMVRVQGRDLDLTLKIGNSGTHSEQNKESS